MFRTPPQKSAADAKPSYPALSPRTQGCRIDIYHGNKKEGLSSLYAVVTDLDQRKKMDVFYVSGSQWYNDKKSILKADLDKFMQDEVPSDTHAVIYSSRSIDFFEGLFNTDFCWRNYSWWNHGAPHAVTFALDYFFNDKGTYERSYDIYHARGADSCLWSSQVFARAKELETLYGSEATAYQSPLAAADKAEQEANAEKYGVRAVR